MFMEFEQGFLADCAEALQRLEEAQPADAASCGTLASDPDSGLPRRSQAFLSALGYLPGTAGIPLSQEVRRNRLALLGLAGWFDRAFQLPMRHAPGAFFFGAQLSPLSFGLSTNGGLPFIGVAGRGLTLRQAFESCVGEAAERLSIHEWPGDRDRRPNRETAWPAPLRICAATASDPVLSGADLRWAWLQMGLSAATDPRSCDWIEAQSLLDGERVLLPAALCLRPAPGRTEAPRPAGTTGCAAGPSLPAATLSALEEVVERDAVARWWRSETPARAVAPELLRGLEIGELAGRVRCDSPRRHWFLDITGPSGIPVFVALSANPGGRAVVAGYGAGIDLRRALTGALLELCQMELAQELALLKRQQRGEEALNAVDRRWIDQHERVTVDSHPQFTPAAPAVDRHDGARSLASTVSRLAQAGYRAFRVDLTRRPLGIRVARVVVPRLETDPPDWTAVCAPCATGERGDRLVRVV